MCRQPAGKRSVLREAENQETQMLVNFVKKLGEKAGERNHRGKQRRGTVEDACLRRGMDSVDAAKEGMTTVDLI